MSANEAKVSKGKRTRSPNYPAISLAEAIPRITQIYDSEFTHPADSDTLSKALGYSGTNGASDAVISALKKYGLLDNAGGRMYKLSDRAVNINLHKKGEPERITAIAEAAFEPPLFAELHDEYGNVLPSEHNLRVKLIKKGFNPKSVGDVINAYRDTLELVSEEAPLYNTAIAGNKEGEHNDAKPAGGTPMQPPRTNQEQGSNPPPPPSTGQGGTPLAGGETELKVFIGQNSQARVIFTGQVTQEAIDLLSELLKIQKRTFPTEADLSRRHATWRNKDHDQPVVVTGDFGVSPDGRRYKRIEGSESGVPEDELEFEDE